LRPTIYRIYGGSTTIFKRNSVFVQDFYLEDEFYNFWFNETPFDNNNNWAASHNDFFFGENTVVNSSFAPFLMIHVRGVVGTRSVGTLKVHNGTFFLPGPTLPACLCSRAKT
jgi:hypothetical protein